MAGIGCLSKRARGTRLSFVGKLSQTQENVVSLGLSADTYFPEGRADLAVASVYARTVNTSRILPVMWKCVVSKVPGARPFNRTASGARVSKFMGGKVGPQASFLNL